MRSHELQHSTRLISSMTWQRLILRYIQMQWQYPPSRNLGWTLCERKLPRYWRIAWRGYRLLFPIPRANWLNSFTGGGTWSRRSTSHKERTSLVAFRARYVDITRNIEFEEEAHVRTKVAKPVCSSARPFSPCRRAVARRTIPGYRWPRIAVIDPGADCSSRTRVTPESPADQRTDPHGQSLADRYGPE